MAVGPAKESFPYVRASGSGERARFPGKTRAELFAPWIGPAVVLLFLLGAAAGAMAGDAFPCAPAPRVPLPRRIVSLAPSITEMLFALGLGPRVVGVTRFSNYPPRAAALPRVGAYNTLNLESILALAPDLVIGVSDGNPREVLARIRSLGIPLCVFNPKTIPDMFHCLRVIGKLTGCEEKGRRLARRLEERYRCIRRLSKGLPHPRVLLQIERSPLVTVNGNTLQSRLIELAGGENIAKNEPMLYPRYGMEEVLQKQPEVIILSSMGPNASLEPELARWRRYPVLPAVRNHRLYIVNSDLISRAGPRILDGLEKIFHMIHPEVRIDCRQAP